MGMMISCFLLGFFLGINLHKEFYNLRTMYFVLHSKTFTAVTNVKFKVIILKEKK